MDSKTKTKKDSWCLCFLLLAEGLHVQTSWLQNASSLLVPTLLFRPDASDISKVKSERRESFSSSLVNGGAERHDCATPLIISSSSFFFFFISVIQASWEEMLCSVSLRGKASSCPRILIEKAQRVAPHARYNLK